MGNIDKEEFVERTKKTIEYAELKCVPIITKELYEKAYSDGKFFSIPHKMFDPEEDKDFIESLFYKFIFKQDGIIVIPDGLYQLLSDDMKEKFINEILRKVQIGCNIDLSYVPKAIMDDYQELFLDISRGEATSDPKIADYEVFDFENIAQVNKRIALGKNDIILEDKGVARLTEYFREYYDDIVVNTLLTYNDDINQDVENLIKYKLYKYDENSILDIDSDNSEEAKKTFEELKEMLLVILKNLSKTGSLEDLVESENGVIGEFNILLSDGNKIEELTQDDIFNKVQNLDMTKKEDVINMLVQLRHYANKLAHNYKDYMWTTLVLNCNDQAKLDEVKGIAQTELDGYIEKRKEFLREMFQKRNMGDITEENFSAIIKDFGKDKKFVKKNLGADNPTAQKKLDIVAENGVVKPRILKYDSPTDYCIDVFEEFELMIKDYYRIRKEEARNGIIEKSFMEFFTDSYYNKNFNEMYGNLSVNKGNKKEKMVDILNDFIPLLRTERMIYQDYKTLSNIIRKYEMREAVFGLKHFCTMALLREFQREQSLIRMENQSPKVKTVSKGNKTTQKVEPGVVDVYLDGYIQAFGGHYKEDELEASDETIQRLDFVNDDISKCFYFGSDKDSLRTFVIIDKLTDKQKEDCRKAYKVFGIVENEYECGEDIDESLYQKIKQIYTTNRELFETLYVRCSLGAGMEYFKNRFQLERVETKGNPEIVTSEERKVADAMLDKIDGRFSVQDFLNSGMVTLSLNIIDYARQEERKKNSDILILE